MLIEWNGSFSVDIASIDEQHKRLIAIINDFHHHVVSNPENEHIILPETVNELFEYVQFHFQFEENLLKQGNYRELSTHIAGHQIMEDHLNDMRNRFNNKEIVLSLEMVIFLQEWLLDHILGEDMKYKGIA